MIYGIILETCICLFLCYTPGVDKVFGSRPLSPIMFGSMGFVFSMMLLFWNEIRKIFMRNAKPKRGEEASFWEDNLNW